MPSISKPATQSSHPQPLRERLDDLARSYYAPLAAFFRKRTRSTPEVEDLVQQVFLRLAQIRDLPEMHNPEGYIFQTAANTLKDHLRHAGVRERYADNLADASDLARSDFSPERVLRGREAVAHLVAALNQLPERTRDILMLRCFEGLKVHEIAQLQGISTRAVEKHLAKALEHVSKAVGRDEARGLS
jgi:RNA polymerase sigma factor (sigma-70 family)